MASDEAFRMHRELTMAAVRGDRDLTAEEQFAELVAEIPDIIRRIIAAAIAVEREACAKLAEDTTLGTICDSDLCPPCRRARRIAAAIRSRK